MTKSTPTKKIDGLPPALVRPHQIRRRKILGNCFIKGVLKMARGKYVFKESDVRRAVRAATKAGMCVTGVRINLQTSQIEVVTGSSQMQQDSTPPLDNWLAKYAHKS